MSGIQGGTGELSDTFRDVFVQGTLTVGTTATELKVGATPNSLREAVRIYNKGDETLYVGPTSSVTVANGEPLYKDQWIEYPITDILTVWGITASSTTNLIITEIG